MCCVITQLLCRVVNERPLALPSKNDSQIIITTTTTTTAAVVSPTITQSVTDTAVVPVVTSSVTTVVAATTANVTAPVIPSIGHTTTGYNATPTVSATDKGNVQHVYISCNYVNMCSSAAPNRHSSFSGAVIAVITGLVSGCIALFGVLLVVYCKCKKTRVSKKSVGATAAVPHKGNIVMCRSPDVTMPLVQC